jgi:hypothetical protein
MRKFSSRKPDRSAPDKTEKVEMDVISFQAPEAGAREIEKPSHELRELGRILYEEMEYLAPSSPESAEDWDKLTSWERSLYINSVEQLLEERELVSQALKLANNNSVPGTVHK